MIMRFLPSLIGLISCSVLAADGASSPSLSDGTWTQTSPAVQIRIRSKKGVEVTLHENKTLPKSIGVTFFDAEGKPTTLELRAADHAREPNRYSGPWKSVTSGGLNADAQSFVGFEIRIPFGSKSPQVLRSQFMKKTPD